MNANKDSTSRQIEFGVVIISTYTDEITIAFGIPVDEHGTPKNIPITLKFSASPREINLNTQLLIGRPLDTSFFGTIFCDDS